MREGSINIQAGMYVKPEIFETHLRFLKKHFNIISLSDLSCNSKRNSGRSNGSPLCILTFDDGWHDFYEHAHPILKTYQIPATVFLQTDFIGSPKMFWTDRLLYFLSQKKTKGNLAIGKLSSTNPVMNQLEKVKGSQEYQLEKAIQMLKAYRDEEIEDILSELSRRWNMNPNHPNRVFLSWEEVKEMGQSGIITFGSHTASHRILTTLTDDEIQDELMRSRERLIAEKVVDKSFIPFSYPNGNYNEKISGMVKEIGYNLAVTTENGWNHLGSNPFTLRRIAIHQDMTSTEAMFGCRITNIF
jgi:peptidoglycan/xylan/chitin deacetylase (PgdA/CDA1 family)